MDHAEANRRGQRGKEVLAEVQEVRSEAPPLSQPLRGRRKLTCQSWHGPRSSRKKGRKLWTSLAP